MRDTGCLSVTLEGKEISLRALAAMLHDTAVNDVWQTSLPLLLLCTICKKVQKEAESILFKRNLSDSEAACKRKKKGNFSPARSSAHNFF